MRRKRLAQFLTAFLAFVAFFCCIGQALALPNLPDTVMYHGSAGEEVARLQAALRELGLYHSEIDGIYGNSTTASVRDLQRLLGVDADGYYGKSTIMAYHQVLKNGVFAAVPIENIASSTSTSAIDLTGKVIGIDPGHQEQADHGLEAIAPGSSRTKERMSAGAAGVKTGIQEYIINLQISKKLKKILEDAGASVVMSRTRNNVSLSNVQRAELMNNAEVDCWVRIHCDYSSNREKAGIQVLTPSKSANSAIHTQSLKLAQCILQAASNETGACALDIVIKSEQTGFNWSQSPVITIELGFLSNPVEDVRLNRDTYQTSCATGIYKGLLAYFAQ